MIVSTTNEKTLLEYVKRIRKACSYEELKELDNEITFDNNVSVKGYALLMNVIDIAKKTYKEV